MNYEVMIIATTVVAVEDASSEQEALELANDQVSFMDFDLHEAKATVCKDEDDWNRTLSHANQKSLRD